MLKLGSKSEAIEVRNQNPGTGNTDAEIVRQKVDAGKSAGTPVVLAPAEHASLVAGVAAARQASIEAETEEQKAREALAVLDSLPLPDYSVSIAGQADPLSIKSSGQITLIDKDGNKQIVESYKSVEEADAILKKYHAQEAGNAEYTVVFSVGTDAGTRVHVANADTVCAYCIRSNCTLDRI